jgi:7-cyano-7-deazaguanine synthase in queuosine biosynthesis
MTDSSLETIFEGSALPGSPPKIILCNGASPIQNLANPVLKLEYRDDVPDKNITIQLPRFVRQAFRLPDRVLDLLEIAGYLYAADRLISRGSRSAVEYHGWARQLHFIIKVRDFNFWNNPAVQNKLAEALVFMTGDKEYKFTFQPGHSTPPTGLFDDPGIVLPEEGDVSVMLFSGGLDSLAGAIELLESSKDVVCLVSHQSGQPGTIKTQNSLFAALKEIYHDRVRHYRFKCSLVSTLNKAVEETQRTRAFIYTSIAYAIASSQHQTGFYVHENGVTSINFVRRQDGINARTSRTTHPQTLASLQDLFSLVQGSKAQITTPFLFKTKSDIFRSLSAHNSENLIPSAVSCSKTFLNRKQASHCGGCFQCVDRRIASYAADLEKVDESGIYDHNFITEANNAEQKTCLIDYISQAKIFAESSLDRFSHDYLNELSYLAEPITHLYSTLDEESAITKIWELCNRHGLEVNKALKRIQGLYDEPYQKRTSDSLLAIMAEQSYLKEPVFRLIETICSQLNKAIPTLFKHNPPKDEQDLNDKIQSTIEGNREDYEREHPGIRFALATTIPDHSFNNHDLVIETKYLRGNTTPSKATEAIAADVTKYGSSNYKMLFVVYDPNRMITDDDRFSSDFEKNGNCTVRVFR